MAIIYNVSFYNRSDKLGIKSCSNCTCIWIIECVLESLLSEQCGSNKSSLDSQGIEINEGMFAINSYDRADFSEVVDPQSSTDKFYAGPAQNTLLSVLGLAGLYFGCG